MKLRQGMQQSHLLWEVDSVNILLQCQHPGAKLPSGLHTPTPTLQRDLVMGSRNLNGA